MKLLFLTLLGLLFVLDAVTRMARLHKGLPVPVTSEQHYRIAMHINMAIGLCLLFICITEFYT